jgi:hypothetical protein
MSLLPQTTSASGGASQLLQGDVANWSRSFNSGEDPMPKRLFSPLWGLTVLAFGLTPSNAAAFVAQDSAGDPVEPAIVRLHDRARNWMISAATQVSRHLVCSTATGLLMPWIISSVMIEPSSMTKFEFDVSRLEPARLRLAVRPTVKPRGEGQAGSFEKMRMKSALRIDI